MKLERTRLVAHIPLPKTRLVRLNQTISKIRLAAPDMKPARSRNQRVSGAESGSGTTVEGARFTGGSRVAPRARRAGEYFSAGRGKRPQLAFLEHQAHG